MEANEENLAHVAELIEKAKAAGLRGADWLESLGAKRCCEGYNGIGPEFLPAGVRALISRKLHIFEAPAVIHDMDNDFADGTREKFLAANDRFRHNCLVMAERTYPGDEKRQLAAKSVAEILFAFVSADSFGWKAWLEATERAKAQRISQDRQDTQDTQDAASPRPGSPGCPGGPGTPQTKGTHK